ncbi:hypothetical protein [Streptomyces cacaoi]|uniref:hypothetical protein n=1 Tax=Streptomyces cacaoi TaxID=1898 RepID=UPI002620ED4D|nr:hypothetical protein [Streptomyces cacaoi]
MQRTPGQSATRRTIVNAASGHTAVVLYACLPDGRDRDLIITELRAYAMARDWDTALEVVDHAPSTPLQERAGWPAVREAIRERRADGVVVLSPSMWDTTVRLDETSFVAFAVRDTPAAAS